MMRWMVVIAALAVAGPAVAFEDVDGSVAKAFPDQRAEIAAGLDETLFDGKSALIKEAMRQHEKTICGMINAKNLAGAYTGYRPFKLMFDHGLFVSDDNVRDRRIAMSDLSIPTGDTACALAKAPG